METRTATAAALSLFLTVALVACGDDGDSKDGDSAKAEQFAVTETQEGNGKWKLTAPKSVKAGLVEVTFTAPAGKGTSHEAQLVRVEGDQSAADVLKVINAGEGAPIPEWLRGTGGVGQTKAGQTGTATQVLQPGKYYVFDDSSPDEGENTKSYAEQGAIASFEVTGDAQTADLPAADATVTAKEYTFTTEGLKAGKNTIEFDNAGKELHHVFAFPYAKGATLDKVKKAFEEEQGGGAKGPPPVKFEESTGTAVIDGGAKQTTELDLKKGKYALVCFIPDRKGGPPHIAKGMIVEANVE